MTIRSVSLLAVSLCFLASESRAQLQVPNVGTLQPLTGESYWGELADDSYGAVTVGDFTGDGRLDAVVLERGSPMLLETPEAFYTSIYASVRAHAIATVRSGGSDLLASLGPDGLVLHRWDGGRGAFESETLALGPWRGGGALAAGDLDGDERGDLVGVALSDPLLVQVLLGSRSTSRLSQGTSFSFRTTTPTHSVFLLDWDGDGRDEIAVVTDRGVEVYTGNGRLLGGSTAVRAGALGATLRMSSSSRDQIAFVQDAAVGGGEEVYLFDSTGLEGPFALGTLGVVGLAAADEDGDGDEELLFSVTSAPAVYILKNLTGTGATFDPARHMRSIPVGDPARDPASNRAGL
ncbi:MAG TPA: VCBS repeat-containing protein, partial [Planctomycetes bacterium]|nr:VCBS repeat-containing protein [Planctomycetota bacterium]